MAIGGIGRARFSLDENSLLPVGPGVYTSKYRVNFSELNLALTATYQDAYSRTGSGLFTGFVLDFNQGTVQVKLTIDSEQIFELTDSNVLDMTVGLPQDGGPASHNTAGGPMWENNTSKFIFFPPNPIKYKSEIKIEVLSSGQNKTLNRYMISLTEG